jgi:hypothetical protein
MKKAALLILTLAAFSGCMEYQLRDRTMHLSTTTTDLLYVQVLDNIARTIENPEAMPYFNMPASGTAQIQQEISATVTPGWGLFASTGAFLFNSITGAVNPLQIDQESWQVSPVPDPDRISLMHAAYLKATGYDSPAVEGILNDYFANRDAWVYIGIQQTDFSRTVWDVWQQLAALKLRMLDEIPAPMDLNDINEWKEVFDYIKADPSSYFPAKPPTDVDREHFTLKDWRDKFAQKLTNYAPYYSALVAIRLKRNVDFQRLNAKYASLQPPPSGTGPGTVGFGGAGASGASSPSGASAAGGKPPLPIHVPYATFVRPGWFHVGKKRDVPRDACFVGCHCKTYVWVTHDQMDALTDFTLAILDFNNIQNSGGSNLPNPPPATLGR